MKKLRIAIDGPAAAGKSSAAKTVAEKLNYIYIDTGAMYRALTFAALKNSLDVKDEAALSDLMTEVKIRLLPGTERQIVKLNDLDVTADIREQEVTDHVSFVASHPKVRMLMVKQQRQMAESGGVVMDGRDIGSHVLPDAEVKFFLKATVEERAKRRYEEQLNQGIKTDLQQLKADIALRDKRDSERTASPLIKAEDAIEIDTTALSLEEVTQKMLNIIHKRV